MLICYDNPEYHDENRANPGVKAEHKKKPMVVVANTVIKPWTMVIHL